MMSDASRRAGRSVGAAAALALGLTGFAALPASAAGDDTVTIDIAAISDFHGHIENAAAVSAYVKALKAENPNTIFAANGDLVGGSAFVSAIQNDEPTIEILNKMGLQVSSTGNHEYDKGYSDLVNRINTKASWPYLVSNIGTADLAKSEVITTDSGVKVGFVGAVTDALPTLVSPDGIAGLNVTDPVAAVNAQAALLKDGDESNGEADIVVALIHETAGISKNVDSNVDAVVAGHTHHQEQVTTAAGGAVVEPGDFGKAIGQITLTYDKATKKATSVSKIADLTADTAAKDPEITPLYEAAQAKASELGAGTAGTIVGGADRATNGEGTGRGANRGSEMTAANLIAQSFYEYSQGMAAKADFGIMNPGGVRADIDADGDGTITLQESFTAQPFGNSYGIIDLTPAQIYTLFEQQWADKSTQESRPMLQLGISDSVFYTYDASAPFGSHIKQVFVNGTLLDRTDTTRTYTIASNAFLLAGGDGFNVFKQGMGYQDTGIIDNEVFNAFLKSNPNYVVDYSQRNIAITGEDALKAGETSEISLASLSMTYATEKQPLPTIVTLKLDGVEIGTADIDNTVTPNLNETGQAKVSVTVPADTYKGMHSLTIVAGPTEVTIPVEVDGPIAPEPTDPTDPAEPPVVEPTDQPSDQPSQAADKPVKKVKKGKLAYTGANATYFAAAGIALLVIGGLVFIIRKRRED
ncbi:5'-nucleotidase C-terminal domain-containing protein [Arcanobacterium haemolyticum]|nr:5'-nucleotidase C-terminal domain-containing protein [Arcanobacterium haemolyticum]